MISVGDIRKRRNGLGLSQIDPARRAGVSQDLLNRLECGRHGNPTVATLEKIERALSEVEGPKGQQGRKGWKTAQAGRQKERRAA